MKVSGLYFSDVREYISKQLVALLFFTYQKEKKISLRSIDIWNGLHGHGAEYVYKETKGNWAAQKAYPNYGVRNDNYAPGNLL